MCSYLGYPATHFAFRMESDLKPDTQEERPLSAPLWARVFFFGWILVQIAVPLWRSGWEDHPTRFGWEMFSSVRFPPRMEVERSDGTTEVQPINHFVGAPRIDVDFQDADLTAVCGRLPDARRLTLTVPGGQTVLLWDCVDR